LRQAAKKGEIEMNQMLTGNRISEVPDKVANWLLDSPIVIRNIKHVDHGGVFAWLTGDSTKKSFIYSEITGYYLTWLCYNASYRTSAAMKCRIKSSADWLINRALNEEKTGFWYRKYAGENDFRRSVYWFDNCMVINGLIHAYRILGDPCYIQISQDLLNLFIDEIHSLNYTIPWKMDHNGCTNEEQWSSQNGSFLLKSLLPIMNISQVNKQFHLQELIYSCLNKYAHFQRPEGNFVTNANDNTYLHPHLYTLEAYWAYGTLTKNMEFIHIAKRGVDWILDRFKAVGYSGYIAADGSAILKGIGSDALSQTIRLMVLMSYPNQEIVSLTTLLVDHYFSESILGYGSFKYGYIIENKWKNDRNCWSSMFGQQALDLLGDDSRRKLLLDNPTYLI
jgi:hypothetical protein